MELLWSNWTHSFCVFLCVCVCMCPRVHDLATLLRNAPNISKMLYELCCGGLGPSENPRQTKTILTRCAINHNYLGMILVQIQQKKKRETRKKEKKYPQKLLSSNLSRCFSEQFNNRSCPAAIVTHRRIPLRCVSGVSGFLALHS